MKPDATIPEQQSGVESNTETFLDFSTAEEAREFFAVAKQRLLDVNGWHHIAGGASADFRLTDSHGREVNRLAQIGDLFKIDIPGPGPVTGDGYDWVQIEKIDEINEEDEQIVSIQVRPATNPLNERKDVAHFFTNDATSSFMVNREHTKLTAAVYGRNEKPNTGAETLVDKARNAAIATGAISGFSKLQWKSLVNGLLRK